MDPLLAKCMPSLLLAYPWMLHLVHLIYPENYPHYHLLDECDIVVLVVLVAVQYVVVAFEYFGLDLWGFTKFNKVRSLHGHTTHKHISTNFYFTILIQIKK